MEETEGKVLQKRADRYGRRRRRTTRREQLERVGRGMERQRKQGGERRTKLSPDCSAAALLHLLDAYNGAWENLHLSGIQLSGIVVINFIGIICTGEPGVRKGLLEPFLLSMPRVR